MISPCFSASDITLPPIGQPASSGASPAATTSPGDAGGAPPKKIVVQAPVPKDRIEEYHPTAFVDYFGPAPWTISSVP